MYVVGGVNIWLEEEAVAVQVYLSRNERMNFCLLLFIFLFHFIINIYPCEGKNVRPRSVLHHGCNI